MENTKCVLPRAIHKAVKCDFVVIDKDDIAFCFRPKPFITVKPDPKKRALCDFDCFKNIQETETKLNTVLGVNE